MEVMQTTLMLKMDEMTGIFRCELSNAVQAIEKTLIELNADNVKLRKELVEVKQVAEENATKVSELKVQLDLVKRHSVENEQYTVIPVMNGHPWDQAKVSVHCRWPLVTGTDGQAGDAKYNTPCNTT